MRRWIMILTCLALVLPAGALAQCSDGEDEICIFWSTDCYACQNCLSFVGGTAAAYVMFMNASEPSGVSGYEFCLCNEDGSSLAPPVGSTIFITGYTYPYYSINAATEPCFAVGIGTPLPWAPCIQLLGINMIVFSPETWCFGLGPMNPSSIPGEMVYAAGDNPGLLKAMHPCTGPGSNPCFMACKFSLPSNQTAKNQ